MPSSNCEVDVLRCRRSDGGATGTFCNQFLFSQRTDDGEFGILLHNARQTTSVFHQATPANSVSYPQRTENKYRPKCGDALRPGSKGRYGSFDRCRHVWVAGKVRDPLLTRAISERLRDEQVTIKRCINKTSFSRFDADNNNSVYMRHVQSPQHA